MILWLAACGDAPNDETSQPMLVGDLAGRYAGPDEDTGKDRFCMRIDPSGDVLFGVATIDPDGRACAGIGDATFNGEFVDLSMAGEEECEIRATLQGPRIVLPGAVPEGCAYYCSPDATLADKVFTKTGDGAKAARNTEDFVGDALCSDVWNAPEVRPIDRSSSARD